MTSKHLNTLEKGIVMRKVFTGYIRLLSLVIILSLSACQKSQPGPMLSPLATNLATPTLSLSPQSGRVILVGQVISTITNTPLYKVPVRLAKVYRERDKAIFVLDSAFSPGAVTDEGGYFSIADIEPGEYVIVVGNPESLYEIISDSSGEAKVWRLMPDQVIDVGVLRVSISP